MATIEELKAQALEVFHADRPGENTAARVGGHLVECVDEEVRHREAVQVVLDELERAVAAAQGVIDSLTAADGEVLRRLQGVSAVSSAMTDPLLNAGNLRTDAALNEYMAAMFAGGSAAMKFTGTVRANVEGKEVVIHQYVSSWGVFYTQTVEGNIRLQADGLVYTVQGEFRKLARRVSVQGGVLTPSAWVEVCSPSLAAALAAAEANAATAKERASLAQGDVASVDAKAQAAVDAFTGLQASVFDLGEFADYNDLDTAAHMSERLTAYMIMTARLAGGARYLFVNCGAAGEIRQYRFFTDGVMYRTAVPRSDGQTAAVTDYYTNKGWKVLGA